MRLARLLMVFISAPVKPGGVHRLTPAGEFEARLVEALTIASHMPKAYEKGLMLREGRVDARRTMIGRIIAESMRESYEATGLEPIPGLHVSALFLSAAKGYLEGSLREGFSRAVMTLLYRSGLESAEEFYGALESVGPPEVLAELSSRGVTRGSIRLNSLSLGDLLEAASHLDSGFWVNLRFYSRILETASAVKGSKSLAEASVKAYAAIVSLMGLNLSLGSIRDMLKVDVNVRRRGFKGERAMGAAFAALALAAEDLGPLSIY